MVQLLGFVCLSYDSVWRIVGAQLSFVEGARANTQGFPTSRPLPAQLPLPEAQPPLISICGPPSRPWSPSQMLPPPGILSQFLSVGGDCWCSEHLVQGSLVALVTMHLGVRSNVLITSMSQAPTTWSRTTHLLLGARHRHRGEPCACVRAGLCLI